MHGTRTANYAMDEADLICAVGARFDDRITGKLAEFAPRAKFIHIDIDPAEISKNVPAHIPIVGDARNVLRKLVERVPRARARTRRGSTTWWARIEGWRAQLSAALRGQHRHRDQAAVHDPGAVRGDRRRGDRRPATSASTRCGRRSTTTSRSRASWINSGGLGTMGFGLPAAMGAKVGSPGRRGLRDRRRRLDPDEHPGARHLRAGGDRREGVHHEQRLPRHGAPVAGALLGPAATARSRWASIRTSSSSPRPTARPACASRTRRTLVEDMRAAIATPGAVVADVRVTREENTYPMIAPGSAARDMVG